VPSVELQYHALLARSGSYGSNATAALPVVKDGLAEAPNHNSQN
jgi:hypothetical protein